MTEKQMNQVVTDLKTELQQKGFTTVHVSENDWNNTITVIINSHKRNPYGASIKQVKYLEGVENIGHWSENGDRCWYSHGQLMGCSKSAISWLLDCAKNNPNIDFDLVII